MEKIIREFLKLDEEITKLQRLINDMKPRVIHELLEMDNGGRNK